MNCAKTIILNANKKKNIVTVLLIFNLLFDVCTTYIVPCVKFIYVKIISLKCKHTTPSILEVYKFRHFCTNKWWLVCSYPDHYYLNLILELICFYEKIKKKKSKR